MWRKCLHIDKFTLPKVFYNYRYDVRSRKEKRCIYITKQQIACNGLFWRLEILADFWILIFDVLNLVEMWLPTQILNQSQTFQHTFLLVTFAVKRSWRRQLSNLCNLFVCFLHKKLLFFLQECLCIFYINIWLTSNGY